MGRSALPPKALPLSELPPWTEDRIKILPMTWKNPVTGALHIQVHPCAAAELLVAPLPAGASREGALFPSGTHLTDLKEVRDLLYKMQRPAIAPNVSTSPQLNEHCHTSSMTALPLRSWCTPTIGESGQRL